MRGPVPGVAAIILVIGCILWLQNANRIVTIETGISGSGKREVECAPLSYPIEQQCAHIREACPESDTFLSLPHLRRYFCAAPAARPAIFAGLLTWLVFLFSTLGIGASDFFCPNLATIALVLGLEENVAGVTLLAFGNGSPDLFSTFSAMRAQSGSLAVGELLGAASFIVSVVVGAMCLIKPFHVIPRPFLRDVGFFTIAVAYLLLILHDGVIRWWEAAGLVCLYVIYVATVVFGSIWEKRRDKNRLRQHIIRREYEEDNLRPHHLEPYRDEATPVPSIALSAPTSRPRASSNTTLPNLVLNVPWVSNSQSPRNVSPSRSPDAPSQMAHFPSFSLLTALEFRDVVASLRSQTSSASLAAFETPITPLGERQYHRSVRTRLPLNAPYIQSPGHEIEPWDVGVDHRVHLEPLHDASPATRSPSSDHSRSRMPSVSPNDSVITPPNRKQRIGFALRHACHILFPHLQNFSTKSYISIIVAIFATPSVFALTITLPVVITPYDGAQESHYTKSDNVSEARLIDFEDDGVERVFAAEDELKEELYETQFNKWLMAVQCVFGPVFCVATILGRDRALMWYLLAAAIGGISAGVLVLVFADRGNDPAPRLIRCSMGFIIAVVWIMTIADEVVSVLKAFGLIFGLSDAIIGLTIFAVGNSLADLIANMSVAAFAPVMGFSACFGGPMLNILIGIGASGLYLTNRTGKDFTLHFSSTLLVSLVGLLILLLATVVFVPWNGFFLSRRWGLSLIISYTIIMAVNIIVEVRKL